MSNLYECSMIIYNQNKIFVYISKSVHPKAVYGVCVYIIYSRIVLLFVAVCVWRIVNKYGAHVVFGCLSTKHIHTHKHTHLNRIITTDSLPVPMDAMCLRWLRYSTALMMPPHSGIIPRAIGPATTTRSEHHHRAAPTRPSTDVPRPLSPPPVRRRRSTPAR